MRAADRDRKHPARERLRAVDPERKAWLARSRAAAACRQIAGHAEEYRALLAAERQHGRVGPEASGGDPDAA